MCKRPPTWPPLRGCKQAMCCDIGDEWWEWAKSGILEDEPQWWVEGKWDACWPWWIGWWWLWWIGWNWGWCDIGCISCFEGDCWLCGCRVGYNQPTTQTGKTVYNQDSMSFYITLSRQRATFTSMAAIDKETAANSDIRTQFNSISS